MQARNSITLFRAVEIVPDNGVQISASARASVSTVTLDMITLMLRQVRRTITTCSALPDHEANAEAVENARHLMDTEVLQRLRGSHIRLTSKLLLQLFSIAIKTQQAGNCYEFSLFMHSLLSKSLLRSEIFRIAGGNHVFIVVNRDQTLSATNYENWNPETIIIDPLFHTIYLASEIESNLQSCVYDPQTNLVSYQAFAIAVIERLGDEV